VNFLRYIKLQKIYKSTINLAGMAAFVQTMARFPCSDIFDGLLPLRRLPSLARAYLPHGRRIVLTVTLTVWLLGIPMIFYSLGTWREFGRVLAAPFSH